MDNKVSPVTVPIKSQNEGVIAAKELRCPKCQLVKPCSCPCERRRLSEVQLLDFELHEQQELAADAVRSMVRKRKSSTSVSSHPSNTSLHADHTDQYMAWETIIGQAEKIANANLHPTWFSKAKDHMFCASADNKLALKLYGNKAAVMMEQKRQAQKGQGIIHPFSTFRWYWDIIMVVLITTHVLLLPVGIAFVNADASPAWLSLNCVSDAIFIADIYLNFRTGIIDFNRQEEVILDKKSIRRNYLHGWFVVDVLSSLPFDYVYLIASSGNPDQHSEIVQASRILRILKLTKLLSLLKLLRVSRIVRYIKELEELLNIQSGQMRILKLIGCMLLLSHWNGCVQFLIPRLQDFPDNSWVVVNGLKEKPTFQQYSWSLFNAMSHMLCIGYGRFPPQNTTELWVTLCSMTIGATFYAVFIGIMSTLIMSIDSSGRLYKEKLSQVGEYMRYRKLPLHLRRRVQDYYEHRYHHKLFDENGILNELSLPLRQEIQVHNARSLLSSVPFFENASEDLITEAASLLKFEVFLPGEFICKRGHKGEKMYFIVRGIVDILTVDGFVATSLADGSHFGEISLLQEENRRVASCRAATMLDLYSLKTDDFKKIIKEFPEMHSVLKDVAKERISRLGHYSAEARVHQVKRDYKTEKVTSIADGDAETTSKKQLGALKTPTLAKGFLRSMTAGFIVSMENKTGIKRKSNVAKVGTLSNDTGEGQEATTDPTSSVQDNETNI